MIWFWFFMMFCDLLIPATMIIFGSRFSKTAPQKINYIFGYRTEMSMKNTDTWVFAHNFIAKLWKRLGVIMAVLSAGVMLLFFGRDVETAGNVGLIVCFAQFIPMIWSIVSTEKTLKKTFDRFGLRRK